MKLTLRECLCVRSSEQSWNKLQIIWMLHTFVQEKSLVRCRCRLKISIFYIKPTQQLHVSNGRFFLLFIWKKYAKCSFSGSMQLFFVLVDRTATRTTDYQIAEEWFASGARSMRKWQHNRIQIENQLTYRISGLKTLSIWCLAFNTRFHSFDFLFFSLCICSLLSLSFYLLSLFSLIFSHCVCVSLSSSEYVYFWLLLATKILLYRMVNSNWWNGSLK